MTVIKPDSKIRAAFYYCLTGTLVSFVILPAIASATDCLQQLRSLDRLLASDQAVEQTDSIAGNLQITLTEEQLKRVTALRESAELLYYAGRQQTCKETVKAARNLLQLDERLQLLSANHLLGYPIVSLQGDTLGEIEDIIIDVGEDAIAYVVIALGGFLGLGEELTPVPFNALKPALDEEALVLSITADRLTRAPRFQTEQMPQMDDRNWGESIHAYYGKRPYWTANENVVAVTTTDTVEDKATAEHSPSNEEIAQQKQQVSDSENSVSEPIAEDATIAEASEPPPLPIDMIDPEQIPQQLSDRIHQIVDWPIVNQLGQQVGALYDVVLSRENQYYYAVVTLAEESRVVVPFDRLRIKDQALRLLAKVNQSDLQRQPVYQSANYISLGRNQN